MKMSTIRIGNRCSVGADSVVLYGTEMKDGASDEHAAEEVRRTGCSIWNVRPMLVNFKRNGKTP